MGPTGKQSAPKTKKPESDPKPPKKTDDDAEIFAPKGVDPQEVVREAEDTPQSEVSLDHELIEDESVDLLYDWVYRTMGPKNGWFRAPGYHASQMFWTCSRTPVFAEAFPELDEEDVPDPHSMINWDFGTATHEWWQNRYFGPMRWLWGDWMCSRCRYVVEDSYMPKDPCSRCNWPDGDPYDSGDERVSCMWSCRWPDEKGFDDPERDCNLCRRWGEWEYQEPGIHVPELNLHGHCDGILKIQEPGFPDKMGLEMKTINEKRFNSLTGPIRYHVFQFQIYLHFLGLKHGIILYIHKGEYNPKNGDKPKAYFVQYDPAIVEEAISRIKDSEEGKKTKKLGHRICPGKDSWQAKRCPFYSVCYLDDIDQQVEEILGGSRE